MTKNIDRLQIYSILQQIERVLESSVRAKLTVGNKRIVDLDVLYDLMGDLKVSIPDDLRRANSVLTEVDTIISEADERANNIIQSAERRASMTIDKANAKAAQILEEATSIYEQKIAEHPVYLEAQKRAQLIMRKAEYNSNVVFDEAKRYSDQVLSELLSYLSTYQSEITSNRAKLNVKARNSRSEEITQEQEFIETPYQESERPDDFDDEPQESEPVKRSFMDNVKHAFSGIASAFYVESDEEE